MFKEGELSQLVDCTAIKMTEGIAFTTSTRLQERLVIDGVNYGRIFTVITRQADRGYITETFPHRVPGVLEPVSLEEFTSPSNTISDGVLNHIYVLSYLTEKHGYESNEQFTKHCLLRRSI
jgi:hypothetical protein